MSSWIKKKKGIVYVNLPYIVFVFQIQKCHWFIDCFVDRTRLRIQHLVEKEKLVLAVEQEILRVHGRAERAVANQVRAYYYIQTSPSCLY